MALSRRVMLTDTLDFRRNFESWKYDSLASIWNIDVDARIDTLCTHVRARKEVSWPFGTP